jgi:hypothetical protein
VRREASALYALAARVSVGDVQRGVAVDLLRGCGDGESRRGEAPADRGPEFGVQSAQVGDLFAAAGAVPRHRPLDVAQDLEDGRLVEVGAGDVQD